MKTRGHEPLLTPQEGPPGTATYLRVQVADQQDRIPGPAQAWDGDAARCCRRRRRRWDGQGRQGPVHVGDGQACGGRGGYR